MFEPASVVGERPPHVVVFAHLVELSVHLADCEQRLAVVVAERLEDLFLHFVREWAQCTEQRPLIVGPLLPTKLRLGV